jgi:hypothetical protein
VQQHQQEPVATLLYRVEVMEKDIGYLKSQLNLYEPTRENDLKLSRINDTVGRIETELSKVKDRLEGMNTRMVTQEKEYRDRDDAQRASQDKLQIRVLWGIVSTVIAILSAVLIGYLTHIIH